MDEGIQIIFDLAEGMILLMGGIVGTLLVAIIAAMVWAKFVEYLNDVEERYSSYEENVTKNKYTLLTLEELKKYYTVAPKRFKLSLDNISYSTTAGEIINIMLTKRDYGRFCKIFTDKHKKDEIFPENHKITAKFLECVKSDVSKAKETADEYLKESQKIMDEQVKVMKGSGKQE